jgi:hypothetical protein
MALKIEVKHKGKMVEGYLQIQYIKTGRGIQSERGGVMTSTNNKSPLPKFNSIISYTVKKEIGGEEEYLKGELTLPYELDNKENVLEYAYGKLKKLFKDPKKNSKVVEDC